MKKIVSLLASGLLFTVSFAQVSLNPIIQHKIDTKLNYFYSKLSKKYTLKDEIWKLINIEKKIDVLLKRIQNPFVINVLRYVQYKISIKIHQLQREFYGKIDQK